MTEHLIYGMIGFLFGGLVGGYLVGLTCTREARRRITELEAEREELIAEAHKTAEKGLLGRQKAIEEAESHLTELEKLSQRYKSPEFDEHMTDRTHPTDDEGEDDDLEEDDICVIDEQDFINDMNAMENETLTFYQEDGVLVDISNEPIANPERLIGMDALDKAEDTDDDFIYVRNDFKDMMFEIAVEHNMSYYRDILGL